MRSDNMDYSKCCISCNCEISKSASFCSKCGTPQIKNTLIHEKSTASYDPGSVDLKPWRERGALATNHWRDRVSNVSVAIKAPWRPPMKQYKVFVKKVIGEKPPTIPWPEDMQRNKSVVVISPSLKKAVSLSSARTVKYKGRLWAKPGEKVRNRKTVFTQDNLYSKLPPASALTEILEDEDIRAPEETFLLGAYLANWMDLPLPSPSPSPSEAPYRTMTSLHLALHQHTRESTLGQEISTYWLRVGYVVDRLDDSSASPDGEPLGGGSDLIVVDFLPNEVAKCMGVAADDWVDLKYVR